MKNLKFFVLACVFLFSIDTVWAQSVPVSGTNLSGTITTTNTFQPIQGQTNNRIGCSIQNLSASNDQWVFFGSCTAATKAASVVLQPGQSAYCSIAGNIVLKDPVCITGTSADGYFANFQ